MSESAIPTGWAVARIPDLVARSGRFVDGDWVESKDQDAAGAIRLTQLADVGDGVWRNRSSRYLTPEKARELRCTILKKGDVLVARMPDPLGRSCLFPGGSQDCVTVVDVCIVRPGHDGVSARWLSHFINAPQSRSAIHRLQSGSTRKRISRNNLGTVELLIPPTNEQHRIADAIESYFTRLDDAVATLERMQRNLKRYRASVLQAAFEGRLVPTEAELAQAANRSYEPASVLLERILAERRHRWENAELAKMKAKGKVPKDDKWKAEYVEPAAPDTTDLPALPDGWCWSSLGELFDVHVGATPSRAKPEYWDGGIPWVSSGEVAFCRIAETRETISAAGLRSSSTQLNPAGSVLLGMIGEGRTRGQAAILTIPACNNQNSAAIRVSEAGLAPEYVYYFLMGQYEVTRTRGSGNNQPALNKSRVQAIPIPLPPLAEARRIVEHIERHESVIGSLEASLQASTARVERLRQSILKWAFEGRLVDQDPTDEPTSRLLERIRAERESADDKTPRKPRRANVKTSKS